MFNSQIATKNNQFMVLTNLKLHQRDDFPNIQKILKEKVNNLICVNAGYFVTHIVKLINGELKRLGSIAFLCIVILLGIFYGIRFSVPMVLPLIVSLIWTFGIMGWLGIGINFMNCIIVLFVFGLVIDYSVFLCSAFKHYSPRQSDIEHLGRSSGAILISAMTTMFGIGAVALADHPALKIVGVTTLIGISSGLFAVLLIVPLSTKALAKQS